MKNLLIKPNSSIKNAFKKFTQEGEKCLVVVDNKNKLLGTLSDGDIRKAVLRGEFNKDKISGFYYKNPTFVKKENYTIEQIKNIFEKKRIDVIPVVSANKTVIDILTFENIFKKKKIRKYNKKISTTVVIMAGGKGTRLEPFTNVLPKPLVPINEKPVIEHIIEKFDKNNVSNYLITLNYKSKVLRAFFQEMKSKRKLSFIEEPKPLGTAGGLRLILNKVKKPFLVTSCDTIININFDDLMNYHISRGNDLTLVVSSKEYIIPYGTCTLNKKGDLQKIVEKPKLDFFVNIGLYVINPNLVKLLPKNKPYDMPDLIQLAKNKRKKIGVYPIDEESWIDVGQWSEYRKAVDRLI